MKQSSQFWDKMAKKYPRYNDEAIKHDAKIIFDTAKSFGVDFNAKSILDIGCGTGTLAIPLADDAKKVVALDLSQPMLDVFEKDKKKLQLGEKIEILHSSWDEYELKDAFDIVLASMTPAVSTTKQYDKLIEATQGYGIFVGWGSYKKNDIIDAILQNTDQEKKQNLNQAQRFANYLQSKKINHTINFFETSWSNEYSLDDAIDHAISHLENVQISLSKQLVQSVLQEFVQNKKVNFTTNAQKGIVVFSI